MDESAPKIGLLVLTSTFPRWQDDHEPPFVFELARRLTDRFDVTVLAPHTAGAKTHETMDGVVVERFHYAPERLQRLAYNGGIPTKLKRSAWYGLLIPGFIAALALATRRVLRNRRPAVVHSHWLLPQGVIAALAIRHLKPRPRLLTTAHGADLFAFDGAFGRQLKRIALAKADVVTVVSRALRDKALSVGARPTTLQVVSMGVDLRQTFVPGAARVSEPVLAFAGRLVEKKGAAELLRAMPQVLTAYPQARLLIAGDGPLAQMLAALATSLGVAHAVEFVGSMPNAHMPTFYRRARLVVLPFCAAVGGDQEGLGLVAVEAMGCELPVIAGDVPAIHDVIRHGENGWLVPPADPVAIADGIIRLLDNPELADRLAKRGRTDAVDRFDWSSIAASYRQLLTENPTPTNAPIPR